MDWKRSTVVRLWGCDERGCQLVAVLASGSVVPGDELSYLIAERGHFIFGGFGLSGGTPTGTVLTLIIDAQTGQVADSGLSDGYPNLGRLGRVHTDLRRKRRQRPVRGSLVRRRLRTAGNARRQIAAVRGFRWCGWRAPATRTTCAPPARASGAWPTAGSPYFPPDVSILRPASAPARLVGGAVWDRRGGALDQRHMADNLGVGPAGADDALAGIRDPAALLDRAWALEPWGR
jgi:hypothetical protein